MVENGYRLAPLFEAYYEKWRGTNTPTVLRLRPDWFEFLDDHFRRLAAEQQGKPIPERVSDPRFMSCRVELAPDLYLPWELK